ncbi:MAG: dipeptidase PepE [Gemmatimonadaceae bacterium]
MTVAGYDQRRMLLLSNSRDEAGRFLQHLGEDLAEHLADVRTVTFIPYAGVTISWDAYAHQVREAMAPFGVKLTSVHDTDNARAAIHDAEAIAVGGGNTFHLLANVQREQLTDVIRNKCLSGTPYLGWSAGSVIACPTMQTTNDMPITQPESFNALELVRFQINAHFTDAHPPGFQGETRRQRLAEFVAANPGVSVIGLPEGTWLKVRGNSVVLRGQHVALRFRLNADELMLERDVELASELETVQSDQDL